MKTRHALIAAFGLIAASYTIGFRQGRYNRPVPFTPPPVSAFRSDDVDYGISFFQHSGPLYISWDTENNYATAYYESSGFISKVRGKMVLRYNPVTGDKMGNYDIKKSENEPNKALQPTVMPVTDAAAQPPRQS